MSWMEQCPYCRFPMECDTVDVGVGHVQCGPYCCDNCGASEIGPERHKKTYDDKWNIISSEDQADALGLDADERRTNFYKNRISPLANQHNGKVISHKQADALYREQYFDLHGNPYNAPIIRP